MRQSPAVCRALLYHGKERKMTIQLYDRDSGMKEFAARVLDCRPVEDGYEILLDQTAFFPEGGGQTADRGVLRMMQSEGSTESANEVHVLDVQHTEKGILHRTDGPLPVGGAVVGVLDWQERFTKMQHHTGEHIVSGLIHRHFGYHNVGFHLGSQGATFDFDGVLTREELRQIEREANMAVAANVPVRVIYPSYEERENYIYRSKMEIEGQLRLVEIPGYDLCACCAPHVSTTGQIGLIKLVSMEHFRGGVRVQMLCGLSALADYNEKADSVRSISQSLSAREDRVAEAVEKLKQEIFRQKGENMALSRALLECKVAAIAPDSEKVVMIEPGLEGNQPRELVNRLLEKGVIEAFVFAGKDTDGYRYVLGSRSKDMREAAKKINAALHGRGGGKAEMVQGSVACTEEEIRVFLQL